MTNEIITNTIVEELCEKKLIQPSMQLIVRDAVADALNDIGFNGNDYLKITHCWQCLCWDKERKFCTYHHCFMQNDEYCNTGNGMRRPTGRNDKA